MKLEDAAEQAKQEQLSELKKALLKPGSRYKFRELKECSGIKLDEKLHELIGDLRATGMKIMHSRLDRTYYLSTVPTPYSDYFDMTWLPKKGTLGLISDTHSCSDAERPDLMEKAYDDFKKHGIKTVVHAGDIMDGWQVYRGHEQHVKMCGGAAQAKYTGETYPQGYEMETYFIGGNHDLKSFEKTGIDQCSLLVNGFDFNGKHIEPRKDMKYLGQYSRFLRFPNELSVQVLHPRGSNTYAKSYAQQTRAREMKTETRPHLQITGHMHQMNYLKEDITHMLAMPGMQDETEFFIRQGYRRDLGYVILDYECGRTKFDRIRIEPIELE